MSRTFHLIPHTHWDREWYLPRAAFEARLVPFIDQLLETLEQCADLRFHLDGQTVAIEDYLAAAPAAGERIRGLVSRGQLGLGPWYVLADELIPSGESLIRNLLLGTRDARTLGGAVPVLYSPDAFGHPGFLPSLAGEFGLRFAVVWRGLGLPSGIERDLYRWRAADGQAVLVYHLPPAGYEIGAGLVGPEAELEPEWARIRSPLIRRSQSSQVAVFVGADHHAFDPRLPAIRDRLQELEPEHVVRISSLAEFFAAVERENPALGEIEGELRSSYGYTWTLQGVHGTRARLKRAHAEAELALLRIAEPLAAMLRWQGGGSQSAVLGLAWRRLIQAQFHDTIAGTVDDRVALEQTVRLEAVRAAAREVARSSLAGLTGHDFDRARETSGGRPAPLGGNPVPAGRARIVTALITAFRRDVLVGPPAGRLPRTGPGWEDLHLIGPDGSPIPLQVLARRAGTERIDAPRHYPDLDLVDRVFVAFRTPEVPGLGALCLTCAPGGRPVGARAAVRIRGDTLANDRVRVGPGRAGLVELEGPGRGGPKAHTFRVTLDLESEPDRGDTYTPSILSEAKPLRAERRGIEWLAGGPLVGAVGAGFAISTGDGTIDGRLAVSLDADSPLVRIRIDLDTSLPDHRTRLRVRTGLVGPVLAGAPAGQEMRDPAGPRTVPGGAESPVPTAMAQRFVRVGADGQWLAVFGPGTFEYEWTTRGELFLTLVRSIGALSRDDLPERPGHAGWPADTPLAQELGPHRIELALLAGDSERLGTAAGLARAWEDAFLPPLALWVRNFVGAPGARTGVSLVGDDLSFEALKPADDGDGLILRCLNRSSRAGRGAWRLGEPMAGASRVRADETESHPLAIGAGKREVRFEYGPHELVSIRVRPVRTA